MWSVALATVTGNTVSFLIRQDSSDFWTEITLALLALVVCCLQFFVGRRIGRRFRDKVAGTQGLGQKNTILAIWMAQTYLNPIASVAPGFYVVWQNIVNSYQLWRTASKIYAADLVERDCQKSIFWESRWSQQGPTIDPNRLTQTEQGHAIAG